MELGVKEVRQVLLNPFANAQVLEALLAVRRLATMVEVRAAVCRDRRCPQHVAMRHLGGLFWRDLMEIARDTSIPAGTRRVAERTLNQRLPRLTAGEKIALARRASPAVLAELRHDPSPRVIAAVLENSRLTEDTLLPMILAERTHPRLLQMIADAPRWGRRYDVRFALARNPRTPFRVLFEILDTLQVDDLRTIIAQDSHASIVRHRASQRIRERTPRGRRGEEE